MTGYRQERNVEDIVRKHEALVRRVAHHLHGRVRNFVDFDDLLQVGFIGLIQAAQRYSPQEGVNFEAYAVLRVRGAMYDFLRKESNLDRGMIRMQQAVSRAKRRLEVELQREPTQAEIASTLSISIEDLVRWEGRFAANVSASLDEVCDESSLWFAAGDTDAGDEIDRGRLRAAMIDALKTLPDREALALQLYYVEGFNIHEVGAVLKVSPGRVSQLKSAAFKRLRTALETEYAGIA